MAGSVAAPEAEIDCRSPCVSFRILLVVVESSLAAPTLTLPRKRGREMRAGRGGAHLLESPFCSPSLELRAAFFQESAAALLVVVAEIAGFDCAMCGLQIFSSAFGERGFDSKFRCLYGQRRIAGDACGVFARIRFQLRQRDDAVDQAHRQRFAGVELAAGVENFLGEGRTDEIDGELHTFLGIANAEQRRRYAKARVVGGEAQVATNRDAESTTDAMTA